MNNRGIGRSGDLPASFDLSKYDCCASFTTIDWYVNLSLRQARSHLGRAPLGVATVEDSEGFAEIHDLSAAQRADVWLQNPIRVPDIKMMSVMANMGRQLPDLRRQVVDQRVFHLFESDRFLDPRNETARVYLDAHSTYQKRKDEKRLRDPSFDAAMKRLSAPAWEALRDCDRQFRGVVPVFVDLHATDSKVVRDFEAWLCDIRSATGIEPRKRDFGKRVYESWHENRILAYLDLTYWAQANDMAITQPVLGAALFPDDFDTGLSDRIRKVVMRHADVAIALAGIDALHKQMVEELEQEPEQK